MRFGTLCPDPVLRKQSEEFFSFSFSSLRARERCDRTSPHVSPSRFIARTCKEQVMYARFRENFRGF